MGRTATQSLVVPSLVDDWVKGYRFVNLLLKAGNNVLWARTSLHGRTDSGAKSFLPGTFVIPLGSRNGENQFQGLISPGQVIEEARRFGLNGVAVEGEIEGELSYLRPPKVALYADGGSPYPFADILSSVGIECSSVTAVDIRNGQLSGYDVFVIPGGGFEGPPIQGALLGDDGRRAVKEFVHRGGGLWGSCAGCCNLVHMREETLKSWEALFKDWPPMQSLDVINAEYWSVGMPGVGKLDVKNVNPNHPVMFGLPEAFELTWHLGPFLSPLDSKTREASLPVPLVQLKGFTHEWTSSEYTFSHSKQFQQGALDNTYAGRGISEQRYGVIAGYYGLGKVCASGAHPEFGLDWLLEKWGVPARMVPNFVFWTVSSGVPNFSGVGSARPPKAMTTNSALVAHKMMVERCSQLRKQARKLVAKSKGPTPPWLSEETAEASFGKSGVQKWRGIVRRLAELPDQVETASSSVLEDRMMLLDLMERCRRLETQLGNVGRAGDVVTLKSIEEAIDAQLANANDDCFYRRPAEWKQDYGWNGALALLDSALKAADYALKNYNNRDATSADSPYHALWAWYLGGLYDLINALTVLRSRERALKDMARISDLALRRTLAEASPKVRV